MRKTSWGSDGTESKKGLNQGWVGWSKLPCPVWAVSDTLLLAHDDTFGLAPGSEVFTNVFSSKSLFFVPVCTSACRLSNTLALTPAKSAIMRKGFLGDFVAKTTSC